MLKMYSIRSPKGSKFILLSFLLLLLVLSVSGCAGNQKSAADQPSSAEPETSSYTEPDIIYTAHRGYSAKAPENSFPAFAKAMDAGFNGIELDVWESKTADDPDEPELFVVHDVDLLLKTGTNILAYEINSSNREEHMICQNVNGLEEYGPQLIHTLQESLDYIYSEAEKRGYDDYLVEVDIQWFEDYYISDAALKEIVSLAGKHHVNILTGDLEVSKKVVSYKKYDTTKVWYWTELETEQERLQVIDQAGKIGVDGISMPFMYMSDEAIALAGSYDMKIGGYNIFTRDDVNKWIDAGCSRFCLDEILF